MNLRRDVFQAISDPTRRSILLLLASQTMTAGTIASNFDTARPTISKHIQILSECELVQRNKKGREIYYQINIDKMKVIDNYLEQIRAIWNDRFNQLDHVLLTLKNKNS